MMSTAPRRSWPSRLTGPQRRTTLRIENLENRALPSTLTVTNLSDGDPGSLRDELARARTGDTIDFAPDLSGTIVLTSDELRVDQGVTIAGPGPDRIAVSGGNSFRVFEVAAGTDASIGGLAITAGRVTATGAGTGRGAGIANYGDLTLTDCDVSANAITGSSSALALGTGIYNAGNLTLMGCDVSRNNAAVDTSEGAGIWNGSGVLNLLNCTLSSNRAGGIGGGHGGGVFNAGGTVTVTDCTFADNSTSRGSGSGGGIDNNAGSLAVTDSIFFGNIAAEGAGINNAGTLIMSGSTLAQNHSSFSGGSGGGLHNIGRVELVNCSIAGNSQTGNGGTAGGLYSSASGTLILTACTVTGNSARDRFDGVGGLQSDGGIQLQNTIVAGNASGSGRPDVFGVFTSLGYNLIGVSDQSSGWNGSDLLGTAANPLDPGLGVLGDNGGPTPTIPLLAGSPALNAGDPDELGNTDQRGVVRAGGVNIGAYQASASAFVLTAPDTVAAGVPFDVTVTAVDTFNQVAVGYTGTVTFSTSDLDPSVVLPADYTFTPDDGGVHTFTDTGPGEVTLVTPGDQTVTATDTTDGTITGSATITVSSAAPGRRLPNSEGSAPAHPCTWSEPLPLALARNETDRFFGSLRVGDIDFMWSSSHQRRG